MHKILFCALAGLLTGCATYGYRSASDPNRTVANTGLSEGVTRGDASAALIYQVLAQVLREPEKKRLLWGQCRVRTQEAINIFTPCLNVEIGLVTEEGKEVASTRTDEGRFSFNVEVRRAYRLTLKSNRYKLPADKIGPFTGGDGVTIDLAPAS